MHKYDDEYPNFNPRIVVECVRDAHGYYSEHRIDQRYEFTALDLIRRFVSIEGRPREIESLFASALYVITRHPWSHPNPLTKIELANKLLIKESSLDWYTDAIVEKLGFEVLHDKNQYPFYFDPQGTIASVIDSIVRNSVGEEMVQSIVRGGVVSPDALTERIVDRLCSVVKIIPPVFERELHLLVKKKIEEESEKLLSLYGPRRDV